MTNQEILAYLRTIESNNGKNFNHHTIGAGLDKGTQAAGNWGLTASTINDTVKNNPHYSQLLAMQPTEKKQYIETHPQDEQDIANALITRLQQRYAGDPSKIAYAWNHGTYINPAKITPDVLSHDDYTNKFQKLAQKLNGASPQPNSFQNVDRNPIKDNIAQQTDQATPMAVKSEIDEPTIRDFITDPNNPFNRTFTADNDDDSEDNDLKKKYSSLI